MDGPSEVLKSVRWNWTDEISPPGREVLPSRLESKFLLLFLFELHWIR
jgi:hypothetical protein